MAAAAAGNGFDMEHMLALMREFLFTNGQEGDDLQPAEEPEDYNNDEFD